MEARIQSTIHGLGYCEDGVYFPEPDCFESIRDLIRFLRYDSSSGLARRVCGERNIVLSDLIPIMKSTDTPGTLFDVALRLTINLCQPTITVFHGKAPEDREAWRIFWEMERNLSRTKVAFADFDFMKVLQAKVSSFFRLEWIDRTESMKMLVERIFVLLGYILSIGESEYDQRIIKDAVTGVDSGDRVAFAILRSGLGDVIADVAARQSEHEFHLPLLHIIALIVKQHEPSDIVSAGSERSMEEKTKDDKELRKCLEVESQKILEARHRLGSRHTSFAGSYVVVGMKALNSRNDLVLRKAVKKVDCLEHVYERKVKKRQPKNRRHFEGTQRTHSSPSHVKIELKQFCETLLCHCYNRLMNACRDNAFSGRKSLNQRNADIHYFLVMRFFMEYRRIGSFSTHFVKATLGKESFHHVQTQLDSYLEMARAERREGRAHGLRAQYAVCAYKELLCTLRCMMESGSSEEKEEAEATCKHIMLMEEYRDLSSSIIRRFTPAVLSKTFLRNLVLANHLYVALLERCAKSGNLLKVMKRQKVRKRKTKRLSDITSGEEDDGTNAVDMDDLWENISEQLSDVVNGYEMPSENVNPIDVLLQVDDDVHQRFAALLVQKALRERRIADAVGLYRQARTIWPFEGTFGSNEMSCEEEFIGMRMIYFADLTQVEMEWKMAREIAYKSEQGGEGDLFDGELNKEDELYSEDDEDEGDTRYVTKEVNFSFDDYVAKFARADVLKWYLFLLNDYETNSADLNRAILKMLHRVAFDLHQAPRLFQISLFRIFTRLAERYQNQTLSSIKVDRFFHLYEFGHHLLKNFFTCYEIIGSRLMPELLFWKGAKECHDLEYGYGSYDALLIEKKSKEMLWTEELDDEIRSLYDEYVAYDDKPEGIDVVDFVESNLSRERTRRQIIREMKSLGLDTFGAKVKKSMVNRGPKLTLFMPDEIEHMKALADQYQSLPSEEQSVDVVDYIRERLPDQYSRARIIKQLKYEHVEYASKTTARSHKAWNDMLLTELRSLAEQYEELAEKPSCGLLDYIRMRLTERRTRRDIEARLIDIGYDRGKLRASKGLARVPKPWSELLLTELCSLKAQYEELDEKPQCSLVDYVITRLSEKRWRRDVVAKLAELGVDVSSMEQKRMRKSNKRNSPQQKEEGNEEGSEHSVTSAASDSRERTPSIALSEELDLVDDLDDLLVSGPFDAETKRINLTAEAEMLFGESSDEDDDEIIRRGKRRMGNVSPLSDESNERAVEPSAPSHKRRVVLSDDEDE
ncbi:Protein timeless -like protein [Toxocara canis]|uniref:Protein timeless-like protein n=1 Tax=Toxocara canis TaxID=6265 RepID=A0A0B2V9X2_TOXCA|nr:Protein timeless -like protein [Toxocara canis]